MPPASSSVHKPRKRAAVSKKPRKNERRKLELINKLADTNSFEIENRVMHAKDNYRKLHDLFYSAEKSRDAIKLSYEDAKRALEGARKELGDAEQTLNHARENRDEAWQSLALANKMKDACKAVKGRNQAKRALSKAEISSLEQDNLAMSLVDQIEQSELDSFFGDKAQLDGDQ
ncbi:Ff.00g016740.m01.CDS01 [Fusarium sp. VM40]|nr:Ff.00g016740.m01.CDS01 [Fusarium sp. VM40]